MKLRLPPIVESVKARPLSYDPRTDEFIFYEDVERGRKRIYPLEKLTQEQILKLAIERQLTNVPSTTSVLNGRTFTNEQVAQEMRSGTKFGRQMLDADIPYLKFYLSQFDPGAFERE